MRPSCPESELTFAPPFIFEKVWRGRCIFPYQVYYLCSFFRSQNYSILSNAAFFFYYKSLFIQKVVQMVAVPKK